MNSFTALHFELITTTGRNKRIDRLRRYFKTVSDERDHRWADLLLRSTAQTRFINYDELRECASEFTNLPLWLIEESIEHTGHVTEAISLIVKTHKKHGDIPLHEIMDRIHAPHKQSHEDRVPFIHSAWKILPERSVYLFNRLITAGYRSPISGKELDQVINPENTPSHLLRTIRAALLYVSKNEYTFAVWKDGLLIPIVTTTNGIVSEDHLYIRQFITNNTRERFGPVHSINPELIFEIGYEGLERAPRRKSGVKLICPRIVRRCHNAGLDDVDRVDVLYSMLDEE